MPLLEDISKTCMHQDPGAVTTYETEPDLRLPGDTDAEYPQTTLWVVRLKASSEVQTHWIYKKWLCIPYTDGIAFPSGK